MHWWNGLKSSRAFNGFVVGRIAKERSITLLLGRQKGRGPVAGEGAFASRRRAQTRFTLTSRKPLTLPEERPSSFVCCS